MSDLLALGQLDSPLLRWVLAGALALALLAAGAALRGVARRKHARYAETKRRELLELPAYVLARTSLPLIFALAFLAPLLTLELSAGAERVVRSALTIAAFWQVGVWAVAGVIAWIEHKRRTTLTRDRAVAGSLGIIAFVARAVIWSLVVLLTLDNLGIDITALVAGLGIGGIAVALAVQNVLGDLLASLSITLDRPFVIGDFLVIGDFMGNVEYIGIKTTRLRSLSGEQIVMSNADLLASRVRNFGRMAERRVVFTLGVTYETPRDKLMKLPPLIRRIVEEQPMARFDRSHFASYGDFSLNFETVFYVLSADYNQYMDVQQEIFFRIHQAFEALGVEFAYPARKLWLASAPAPDGGEPEP